jgi:hypothetical protein
MNDKMIFSLICIGIIGLIQVVAFLTGHNGAVFNFTAIIIGAIVGSVLGFTINLKGSVKKYVDEHK